jgi:hypothetical protein
MIQRSKDALLGAVVASLMDRRREELYLFSADFGNAGLLSFPFKSPSHREAPVTIPADAAHTKTCCKDSR